VIVELVRSGRAVLVCPEEEGGLPTPRPPAEIQRGRGDAVLDGSSRVLTNEGRDVTAEYVEGARIAVDRAIVNDCRSAVLKARSPACGCDAVYDGSFSGRVTDGDGVAAAALRTAGVDLWTEEDLPR
jgi:uncharacterized protein YbbK (DUF523 family)